MGIFKLNMGPYCEDGGYADVLPSLVSSNGFVKLGSFVQESFPQRKRLQTQPRSLLSSERLRLYISSWETVSRLSTRFVNLRYSAECFMQFV
jgi:hypothetical protein